MYLENRSSILCPVLPLYPPQDPILTGTLLGPSRIGGWVAILLGPVLEIVNVSSVTSVTLPASIYVYKLLRTTLGTKKGATFPRLKYENGAPDVTLFLVHRSRLMTLDGPVNVHNIVSCILYIHIYISIYLYIYSPPHAPFAFGSHWRDTAPGRMTTYVATLLGSLL